MLWSLSCSIHGAHEASLGGGAQRYTPQLACLPQHQEEEEEEASLQIVGWPPRFRNAAGYGGVELISSRHQKACCCLHRPSRIHSEVIDFK